MKAKKWLTIITLVITALSLVLAFIIGKNSNCITYDISMAIFGGAALGFIMSLTEYYVERRKAMEEFWLQATKVLNELKKIKYLDVDAPINLIVDAIHEDDSNALKKKFHLLSDDEKISVNAKENLISWYKENIPIPFDENTDNNKELTQLYDSNMAGYKAVFLQYGGKNFAKLSYNHQRCDPQHKIDHHQFPILLCHCLYILSKHPYTERQSCCHHNPTVKHKIQ